MVITLRNRSASVGRNVSRCEHAIGWYVVLGTVPFFRPWMYAEDDLSWRMVYKLSFIFSIPNSAVSSISQSSSRLSIIVLIFTSPVARSSR